MSDTPRTDTIYGEQAHKERRVGHGAEELCRTLERELNATRDLLARTRGHISDGKLDAQIAAALA